MPLRIHFAFSDPVRADLRDIVAASAEKGDKKTETDWIFEQLRTLAGNHAVGRRSLQAKGVWEPLDDRGRPIVRVRTEDLHTFPPIDAGTGDLEVLVGDRLLKALNDTGPIVEAANRLRGLPFAWTTLHDWIEGYVVELIIVEMARLDTEDLRDEAENLKEQPIINPPKER